MNTERISPLVDVAFKILFKEKELISFLNSFLDYKISKLEIIPESATQKETLKEKQSYLDLKAITEDGKKINIEVQLSKQPYFEKRSVYYVSKTVTENFYEGDIYEKLPKVIAVNILKFEFYKNTFITPLHFKNIDVNNKIEMADAPEYYFIELPKLRGKLDKNNNFHRWLLFLEPELDIRLFEEVLKMDREIYKAEQKLRVIQSDPVFKAEYDARFKQITDHANWVHEFEKVQEKAEKVEKAEEEAKEAKEAEEKAKKEAKKAKEEAKKVKEEAEKEIFENNKRFVVNLSSRGHTLSEIRELTGIKDPEKYL